MSASELRCMARENLKNRWGQAALIVLIFFACSMAIRFILNAIPLIGPLADCVITPVLSFGLLKQWIKFKNGEEVGYIDFFQLGFENFVMVWKVTLRVILKLAIPIILIIIGSAILSGSMVSGLWMLNHNGVVNENITIITAIIGIIIMLIGIVWSIPISYKYICATNELAYDSERSSKEIVEKSGNHMIGNRLNLFGLQLSFIGWTILAMLSCYIGFLWLTPYMQIATILYYESVSGRLNSENANNENKIFADNPIS